uniref:E8 n=1 Tax=Bovine papillomavirus TaxID=10571 RepID=A3QME8_9PAPI|nr:E8 [Bovine papillomavirus]QYI89630.1 E8 early protein [Bos taurus papillomavirus 9]QYI89636.1 E8 early protein [Bos taurus papillomavirus 9]
MSMRLIYFLLLLWCGFNFLSLLFAVVIYLLLLSAIDNLNGWD